MNLQRLLYLSIIIILGIALELILGLVNSILYSWWQMFFVITCFSLAMGIFSFEKKKDMLLLAVFSLITFSVLLAFNIISINTTTGVESGDDPLIVLYEAITYLGIYKPVLIIFSIFMSFVIGFYQFFISATPIGIRMVLDKYIKKKT
jgi:hypothetical protein